MRRGSVTAAGLLLLCSAMPVAAAPPHGMIGPDLVETMRQYLAHDTVKVMLKAQNARHRSLSPDRIEWLDQQWREQRNAESQPLIAHLAVNPLSNHLLRVQAWSGGLFSEIIVTDAKGLNAGMSAVTSDYYQGDEDKYLKTFPLGPDALFLDTPEWHQPSGTWRQQVNMTIADNETGEPIGTATFEVVLDQLAAGREGGN